MEWALEFISNIDKENTKFLRETMEAKVKAEAGQYGEAARVLWELLIQVRHARERRWECMTMVHLGRVYRALRWTIAVNLLEDAVELADELTFDLAKMMALAELGELKCQWGQFRDSLELLSAALELNEEENLEYRRDILIDMVIAHEGLEDFDECEKLLEEIVVIAKRIKSVDLQDDIEHLERIRKIKAS
jgi:tetratricopeptide (TPR) repeat protein